MTSQRSSSEYEVHRNSEESVQSIERRSWEDPTAARGTVVVNPESARAGQWQTFNEVRWKVGTGNAAYLVCSVQPGSDLFILVHAMVYKATAMAVNCGLSFVPLKKLMTGIQAIRQAPTWPKLSHKQLETFHHTRQMMWIFRAATGYCHWCNQATAELFGPEPFDNFDWGPYCRGGLQGEMKVWLFWPNARSCWSRLIASA